jgi:hypothetical protein
MIQREIIAPELYRLTVVAAQRQVYTLEKGRRPEGRVICRSGSGGGGWES